MRYAKNGFLALALSLSFSAHSDEGMWLYEKPPLDLLKSSFGFEPTQDWLDALKTSSVRFNSGGSGSFVSSNGLLLTNQHVASSTLDEAGKQLGRDLIAGGFYARTTAEEIKAPDLTVEVLHSVDDVTARVTASYDPKATPAEIDAAIKKVSSEIEKECKATTGLRGRVVKLYQGAVFSLYRTKQYSDIRIVFAPEESIAAFGGDADNFEYPRYGLDFALMRAYENGKPVQLKPGQFFPWATQSPKEGELVFISGNPGTTNRLFTASAVRFMRNHFLPALLIRLRRTEGAMTEFAIRSVPNRIAAQAELRSIQNARKNYLGQLRGLQAPDILLKKDARDLRLRQAASEDAALLPHAGAWGAIEKTLATHTRILYRHNLLEKGWAFNSVLFNQARTLVRLAQEDLKPNDQRLTEYRDTNRAELLQALTADVPAHAGFEAAKLTDSLSYLVEALPPDDALVRTVMAGVGPAQRARDLVGKTTLNSAAVRKALAAGKTDAEKKARLETLRRSDDPMIRLAFDVDAASRQVRKTYELEVVTPQSQAYAQIGSVIKAVDGNSGYPDATFTLRFAYGQVLPIQRGTEKIPALTTVEGAFKREKEQGAEFPFKLPASWHAAQGKLDPATAFNFVANHDSISGNSGSPILNKSGELVGLYFDRDIEASGVTAYGYSLSHRGISVSATVIEESLRKVYGAAGLADELGR